MVEIKLENKANVCLACRAFEEVLKCVHSTTKISLVNIIISRTKTEFA